MTIMLTLMSNTATTRRLANALGDLSGAGEVREPMTDNECIVRVVSVIASAAVIAICAIQFMYIYTQSQQNTVARYAIDKGAWACSYDNNGKTVCAPLAVKK